MTADELKKLPAGRVLKRTEGPRGSRCYKWVIYKPYSRNKCDDCNGEISPVGVKLVANAKYFYNLCAACAVTELEEIK